MANRHACENSCVAASRCFGMPLCKDTGCPSGTICCDNVSGVQKNLTEFRSICSTRSIITFRTRELFFHSKQVKIEKFKAWRSLRTRNKAYNMINDSHTTCVFICTKGQVRFLNLRHRHHSRGHFEHVTFVISGGSRSQELSDLTHK